LPIIFVTIMIILKGIYQYRKAINIGMMNFTVKIIYSAIFIWGTCTQHS